ncbi:MAG: hypothetical protein JO284_12390 [Planctomycetaceae bacterium]|nr:hypothetical protein [Planctomycetaceae bacterium]
MGPHTNEISNVINMKYFVTPISTEEEFCLLNLLLGEDPLCSTFALFGARRTPYFPGFPRRAARVFENPRGITGVQKVEIAEFSRFFWAIGLRERAKVELWGPLASSSMSNDKDENVVFLP